MGLLTEYLVGVGKRTVNVAAKAAWLVARAEVDVGKVWRVAVNGPPNVFRTGQVGRCAVDGASHILGHILGILGQIHICSHIQSQFQRQVTTAPRPLLDSRVHSEKEVVFIRLPEEMGTHACLSRVHTHTIRSHNSIVLRTT